MAPGRGLAGAAVVWIAAGVGHLVGQATSPSSGYGGGIYTVIAAVIGLIGAVSVAYITTRPRRRSQADDEVTIPRKRYEELLRTEIRDELQQTEAGESDDRKHNNRR